MAEMPPGFVSESTYEERVRSILPKFQLDKTFFLAERLCSY